jgi:hypothetical protein
VYTALCDCTCVVHLLWKRSGAEVELQFPVALVYNRPLRTG